MFSDTSQTVVCGLQIRVILIMLRTECSDRLEGPLRSVPYRGIIMNPHDQPLQYVSPRRVIVIISLITRFAFVMSIMS